MDAVSVADGESVPVAASAKAQIRERGARIADAEQERAVRRLREQTELSDSDEQVVRELAERLTAELLRGPQTRLDSAASEETVRVAVELFGEG